MLHHSLFLYYYVGADNLLSVQISQQLLHKEVVLHTNGVARLLLLIVNFCNYVRIRLDEMWLVYFEYLNYLYAELMSLIHN